MQNGGEQRAGNNAEQGIRQPRKQIGEPGLAAQGADGGAHGAHAEHQHGKAHQNVADVPFEHGFRKDPQNDADHGDRAGQRCCGKQTFQPARALDIAKTDHPAGDAGAEDGAEDHADALAHLHHAGVHKADHHHRGGAGRLDHARDACAKQQSAQRRAGQPVKDQLQPVAGHALEPVAHGGHAEQKQRHAAKQRDHL